jgi:toxin ParE1/3/4
MMPRAAKDLAAIYREIGGSNAAMAWYDGLKEGIGSLRSNPHRCPLAPEDATLRNWLYGKKPHIYRIVYRVVEKTKRVEVLHIRHGAMHRFVAGDVGGRPN